MERWPAKLGDRSLFPELGSRVYAHHAAIAPPSVAVQIAIETVLTDYAQNGVAAFAIYEQQRARLREKLEALIGAEAGAVALVASTSHGVSDIALCIPWQTGNRVVLFKGEFPANITPWQRAAEHFQLELCWHDARRFLSRPEQALEALEQELRRGVRLVAVSAVQFQTGLCMPLKAIGELCVQHGAELFVDAIQACGVVPIDVQDLKIHYLACGAHKWLMGMEGAGFLYVNPHSAAKLHPLVAGWLSHEEPAKFLFEGSGLLTYDRPLKASARVFETGTLNLLGYVALEAALNLIVELGVHNIFDHVTRYLDRLEPELTRRGFSSLRSRDPGGRSGILSVLPPAGIDLLRLHRGLLARGVVCGVPDGMLRFSPHWPNALAEVPVIPQIIDDILTAP